jgi:DNA-binding beta-propeller fold protein YncE
MRRFFFSAVVLGLFAGLAITAIASAEGTGRSAISPSGTAVAIAQDDRTVKVWPVTVPTKPITVGTPLSGRFLRESALVWNPRFTFSPDGQVFASVRGDEAVKLVGMPDGEERVLRPNTGVTTVIEFSADSKKLLAITHEDKRSGANTLAVWDVASGKMVRLVRKADGSEFVNGTFSRDGKVVYGLVDEGGTGEMTAVGWDIETGKEVYRVVLN